MSESESADIARPQANGNIQKRLRLLAGMGAGALLGALLAWYVGEVKADQENGDGPSAPLKAGDLITLGIEVLGFVKIVFRALKRI